MTLNTPSRATFADLLATVRVAPMPNRRRQDMASAVNTVARVLGHSPAEIPLDLTALNRRLRHVSPQASGMSEARWHNVRSLLRAALALKAPIMRGRQLEPLLQPWEDLVSCIEVRGDRIKLSRLLHWLSAQGVTPDTLSQSDLFRFQKALRGAALIRDPEAVWTNVSLAWNRAASRVASWPNVYITRTSRRKSYVLPWSHFPTSLKQEVDSWLARLAGKDFAEDGPLRPLSPTTLIAREYHLRAFISALVLRGRDPQSLTSLAVCLTLPNFIEGLRFFYERFGSKPSPTTSNLGTMLKSVAKHWVKVDEATLQRMREISRKLDYEYNGLTEKNRTRLHPFQDLKNCQKLLRLPVDLRQAIERGKIPPHRHRVLGQVAVAIELLLMTGLRAKNLASIELARHLLPMGKKLLLTIPAAEVKNGMDLTFDLPAETADLIRWYLKEIRRAEPGCTALFPNAAGAAKDQETLALQINGTVKRYLGFTVNLHLFRHIAAHTYLGLNPGGYEVMRRVLGHKSMDTTSRFYAGLESINAARHFDEQILKLRAASLEKKGIKR